MDDPSEDTRLSYKSNKTDSAIQSVKPEPSEPTQASVHGDPPDGGLRAWLVILGVSAGVGGTFGLVNAWGVFQAYYQETLLQGSSPSNIAWIGSLQYALNFLPGLAVGRLFDMGIFILPLSAASGLLVAATFLTGECTQYWQFLLCQGLAVGLACGVIFNLVVGTPAHWFKRKLGISLGLSSIGSSIGGTVFPIITRSLIQSVGFPWTMRILGFIELFLLSITILTVKRRLPPNRDTGPFINFRAFASAPFILYCIAGFVTFLGLYTVLTYIDISAAEAGISNFSFYLVSIANGSSIIGRLSGGLLADRIGPLNVMMPATFVAGILTYAWPFASSVASWVVIAVIYGISCGVFVSLLPAPIMQLGLTERVGMLIGMSSTICALGAVAGPPISGAINSATGGFKFVGIYAGSTVMLAVLILQATRYAKLGRFWGKC